MTFDYNDAMDLGEELAIARYGACEGCSGPLNDAGECVKMGCPDPQEKRTTDESLWAACGGRSFPFGSLGNITWYKCRDCGSLDNESIAQRPR